MKIKAILAVSDDYVIGYKDKLPWKISDDMILFKEITMGNTLLLGSVTALGMMKNWPQNIPSFLPGRNVVILTRNKEQCINDIKNILQNSSLDVDNVHIIDTRTKTDVDVLQKIKDLNLKGDLFVAGGSKIYKSFIDFVDEIFITFVAANLTEQFDKKDLTFIDIQLVGNILFKFDIIKQSKMLKSDKNEYDCTLYNLTRA